MCQALGRFAAACPKCDSALRVELGQNYLKCQHCDSIIYAPDAVNHFVCSCKAAASKGIDAAALVSDGQDLETLVEEAEARIRLEEYDQAKSCYVGISRCYPWDYRGWWGLIRIETFDFNESRLQTNIPDNLLRAIETTAPPETGSFLLHTINAYYKRCRALLLQNEKAYYKKSSESILLEISQLERKMMQYNKKLAHPWLLAGYAIPLALFAACVATGKWGWFIPWIISLVTLMVVTYKMLDKNQKTREEIAYAAKEISELHAKLDPIFAKFPDLRK